ncbi:protein of unknown function DUF6 transmembrane [Paenibacillus algicola]|uniref:EamA domain-containing protein n=2 Tax=Paenibacillus algicola TaxID=2565926 RepID=A0A4P8XH44_9BACL|nr:DMT family transporter [Paenibacillus algicola]QCT01832.1 protein of unknown function DUF6 transmembrane [Paenibacillus algicola]
MMARAGTSSNLHADGRNYSRLHAGGGFWLVALGAALWGINPLFRVTLLNYMTSAQIVMLEHLLISLIAVPILWRNRAELLSLSWKHAGALLFISWGGSALATILFTAGLSSGNLNAVLLLQKLQPLFAIILASLLLKERLPRHFGWLLGIALAGTYMLTFGLSFPGGNWGQYLQAGSLMSLGAAALWGGSTVMGRMMVGKIKYETVTSLRFVLALPLLSMISWSEGAAWNLPAAGTAEGTAVMLNLAGQALLPGLLSLMIYYKGLTTTKASAATLAELSFPMVGVLINWMVFQETITLAQTLGFVLIWLSLYLLSRQSNHAAVAEQQPSPYRQASA